MNRSAVINLIRQEGVISPTRIASELNISMPTVMRVVEDLVGEDLVERDGFGESTGGRRPAQLKFKGDSYAVIGLDLGAPELFGAVSDLNGRIQTERYVKCHRSSGEANLARLMALIDELLSVKRPHGQKIRGIGVGVPSTVRAPEGQVAWAQELHWSDLPLQRILSERFDQPIFIENRSYLAAVGEWGFGVGQGADCLACLLVGTGTGASVIINGRLYRGHAGAAGEIGWLLHDSDLCGRKFPRLRLEDQNQDRGIRPEVLDTLELVDKEYLSGRLRKEDLTNAATVRQNPSLQIVNEMIEYLTFATAGVCTVINPSTFVLVGDISRGATLIADCLRDRLKGKFPSVPEILVSKLGHRGVAMGAIMTVLDVTTLNRAVSD